MSCEDSTTIEVPIGGDLTLRVSVIDANEDPVNTTGWVMEFTLRDNLNADTVLISLTSATPGEIDAVDAAGGVWDVKLANADTAGVPVGTHVFDVVGTTVDSKIYPVVKRDYLNFYLKVTR